jgi:hypothetical protein
VHVRIDRPLPQPGQRLLRVTLEEDPDAVFGGEPLGQLVLRPHGRLKLVGAEFGDEEHARQVHEHLHAGELATSSFGPSDAMRISIAR